jgi:hypothetical protein
MRRLLLVCLLLGCGDDGGTPSPDGSGGGGDPPNITMVAWTHEGGCTMGAAGDVTVVTTVMDPDTPTGMLTFSGSVSGCTPVGPTQLSSASATITCPNQFPYNGTVRVTDPEQNSDQQAITIEPCVNDSAP